MRRALACAPVALLFLASILPSHAQNAAEPAATTAGAAGAEVLGSAATGGLLYYVVRGPLMLDCRGLAAGDPANIVWTKNDTKVEDIPELKDHLVISKERDQLSVKGRSHEDDFGNYTCSAGGAARAWEVRGKPHASLPANTNVVEGQKLKLTCKLTGKPYPEVRWLYSNVSEEVTNETLEATAVLGDRIKLAPSEQGVAGAQLVLEPAQRSDAGWFTCVPAGGAGSPATTTLRVKDMYAALWPFLGICAEVFILCAIILVYEKRRTKPELDDSDTDNHDQKKS